MKDALSWDDWRVVHAIVSTGSTKRASEALGLNQSTVFRRVVRMEEALGFRLFERDQSGHRLTLEGERLLPDIERLYEAAATLEHRIEAFDGELAGEIRLSVNATLLRYLLADTLAAFAMRWPEILIKLNLSDELVSLRDREADLVIRGSNDPDPELYGRKLLRLHYAVYVNERHASLERLREIYKTDMRQLDWIRIDGGLLRTAPGQWMTETLEGVDPVMTANDMETTAAIAAAGLGCCLLPRFIGDRFPGLAALGPNVPGLHTEVWVLTHENLRRTARVSKLLRHLADNINASIEIPSSSSGA